MVGSGWFMFFVGLGAKRTDIQTYRHLDKDMERERGRKSYLVHNMMHHNNNTIATKPVSGLLLEGER